MLPCLAAISPVALAGLLWMAAGGAGTGGGVGGLSRVMAVSVFLWATALGISVLAVVRSKDRVERALGLVGLVGNVLLLVVGLFWRTWGRNA